MISKEKKAAIIEQYGRKAGDTGSPEVQIQSEGSSFPPRTSEDGRTETWSSGLLKEIRSGRIPCTDREVRHQKVIKIKTYRVEQSTLVVYVEEKSETAAVPVKQKNIFVGRAVVSVLLFTERHFWNRKRRMRM